MDFCSCGHGIITHTHTNTNRATHTHIHFVFASFPIEGAAMIRHAVQKAAVRLVKLTCRKHYAVQIFCKCVRLCVSSLKLHLLRHNFLKQFLYVLLMGVGLQSKRQRCSGCFFAVIPCSDLGNLQSISGVLWSKCSANGPHCASLGDLFFLKGNKNVTEKSFEDRMSC